MKEYDHLVVGAGLFGATIANRLKRDGKKVLVIDKRPNIAGNVYTEEVEGIEEVEEIEGVKANTFGKVNGFYFFFSCSTSR